MKRILWLAAVMAFAADVHAGLCSGLANGGRSRLRMRLALRPF